jgi:trimeric autotransporter adhesin
LELSLNSAGKPGSNAWTITSDERLKTIHGPYSKGLNEILKLKPITYNYSNGNALKLPSDEQFYGFSAQEVQKVFPEAVKTGKDGYLNFDIHPILVSYINAFKEQQLLIDKQQKTIDELIKRVEKLENK